MRRRQLKWLWARLKKLAEMDVSREERLMKLGAARSKAPSAWRLVDIDVDKTGALSPTRSTATSCGRSDAARAAICCAPT